MAKKAKKTQSNKPEILCYCHMVPKKTVEEAIARGCKTMTQIFDATTAGVGPCGGSCRPNIQKLLDSK